MSTLLRTSRSLLIAAAMGGALFSCSAPTANKPPLQDLAAKVEIGMTRDQVVAILGPFEASTMPEGFPPDCDSWRYDANGLTKYIYVKYRFDLPDDSPEPRTVINVSDNHDSYCAVS